MAVIDECMRPVYMRVLVQCPRISDLRKCVQLCPRAAVAVGALTKVDVYAPHTARGVARSSRWQGWGANV
jgi:hypothetical protein